MILSCKEPARFDLSLFRFSPQIVLVLVRRARPRCFARVLRNEGVHLFDLSPPFFRSEKRLSQLLESLDATPVRDLTEVDITPAHEAVIRHSEKLREESNRFAANLFGGSQCISRN